LPDYMIPSYFVRLEKIPLTSNGKVDRRALPEPEIVVKEYIAPRNKIEERLVEIWSEVLGIDKEKISVDANFFELGGHSLKATILMSKIHKAFDIKIGIAEVFKSPTIEGIVILLKSSKTDKYKSIGSAPIKDYYPLSPAQRRMYLLNKIKDGDVSDNCFRVIKFRNGFNKVRFVNTVEKLITRHEAFRTSFEIIDNEPVQVIHNNLDSDIRYYTTNIEEEERKIINEFVQPFDLAKAPLLRIGLIEHGWDSDITLLFDMHHIISDGVSFGILLNDFVMLLDGEDLPPLKLQYKDYAHWVNSFQGTKEIENQKLYWLDVFKEKVPVLNLPYDYSRQAVQSYEGRTINFQLNKDLSSRINLFIRKHSMTMQMYLLAAYNILLYKYTGVKDIVVGSPIAGRTHDDLKDIIGYFINTLAIRNKIDENQTFVEYLNTVKDNCLKAYANQEFQFDDLIKSLDINQADLSRSKLFDTMLNFHNETEFDIQNEHVMKKLDGAVYDYEDKTTQFDIIIHVQENDGQIFFSMKYCINLFKHETMESFANNLSRILDIVDKDIIIRIRDIDISQIKSNKEILYPNVSFEI